MNDAESFEKEIADVSEENLQGLKVLVVDNDDSIQEQLKLYFADLGIENCQFESSATAAMSNMVQQLQSYDLVMTDLNMPNVDGVTFIRFLSKIDYQGALMIISGEDRRLLNSVVQLGKAHKLKILGALQKPFTQSEVTQMLEKMKRLSGKVVSFLGEKALTEDEIRQGLSQGSLELYFQPKVAVDAMSVHSLEALARWRTDDEKILVPYLFIPVAEQSGLINDLTDQVFIKAVQQLAYWHGQGFMCSVAVNFSMSSLERISLPDTLSAICSGYNVSPENITIEITETSIMNHEAVALDVITRLHLKGFRLSIDDFGTGYSSIEQLNKLPFSEIKIDRSFVDGAANNYSSMAILESSIVMGKKMGISIVSEGVENEEDFELLKELGTEYVQGYFFSRPMPADAVHEWVENWNSTFR